MKADFNHGVFPNVIEIVIRNLAFRVSTKSDYSPWGEFPD
jgi:hypothetical protein